jgi:hypothetical protein
LAFFLIRGCMAFTSRQQDHSYDYRPTVSPPRFNQPIWKDKDAGRNFP